MRSVFYKHRVYVHDRKLHRLRAGRILAIMAAVSFMCGSAGVAGFAQAKKLNLLLYKAKGKPYVIAGGSAVVASVAVPNATIAAATTNQQSNTAQAVSAPAYLPCHQQSLSPADPLKTSTNLQLSKLEEYYSICDKSAITTLMTFSGLPRTIAEADEQAADMAQTFKDFSLAGVTPLVIVEPAYSDQKIDLVALQGGSFDTAFSHYLSKLRLLGVNDSMVGTWVFFPEPNIPEWSTLDPTVFKDNTRRFGGIFKTYFKTAKLSILLDSMTYTENNYNGAGQYKSLIPFVDGLPSGLVDSIGYQGFPWSAPSDSGGESNLDAAVFLKSSFAIEAAQKLGVKNIWFNSGTFGTYYANDKSKLVIINYPV